MQFKIAGDVRVPVDPALDIEIILVGRQGGCLEQGLVPYPIAVAFRWANTADDLGLYRLGRFQFNSFKPSPLRILFESVSPEALMIK